MGSCMFLPIYAQDENRSMAMEEVADAYSVQRVFCIGMEDFTPDVGPYLSLWAYSFFGNDFRVSSLNEGIWNVAIRYKFLKEKNASFKLECYDLLKQQKNVTYMMTVNGYNETRNNCISRFVLFTFNYRFSIFS